ncbi:MAG: ATP-binding cassette domain-containing protein [Clostridium sp.]|uniref:ABC transporter ATP-binding protein/permease n=1 Tax=Clostridium chrysemydis TaxID=2665504 RepID=UPI003EE49D8B
MITLRNLGKSFKEIVIYKNVNYTFKKSKLTCFLGPSGSGKTTLLNLLAGFDTNYDGDIEYSGINLKSLSSEELCNYRFNNIGFVFQNYNLFSGYTVLENVLIGINLNDNITEDEKMRRALELLSSLKIKDKKDHKVDTLSGGQRQRVAIARALINKPDIILADEPTGALDDETSFEIMKILKEISKEKTVIVITHDVKVAKLADEIIELENDNIKIKKTDGKEFSVESEKDKKNWIKPKLNNKCAKKISFINFKSHFFKFLMAGILIAFGSASFISALSLKNINNKAIKDFKEKNFYYNSCQIPVDEGIEKNPEDIFDILESNEQINNIYYQYDLENITLENNDKSYTIDYKTPTAIPNESLVYGTMPKENKKEIAIGMNLAKRLSDNPKDILGKMISLKYLDKSGKTNEISLKVIGLTNSIYQDFVLSSNVEKEIYDNYVKNGAKRKAIYFEIKDFEKIPEISEELMSKGIDALTKSYDVKSFQNSFVRLIKLFTSLAYIILTLGVSISSIMLYKISIERYREIGIFKAIGYSKKNIKWIMLKESLYFSGISTFLSVIFTFTISVIYKYKFGYSLDLNYISFIVLIIVNSVLTLGITNLINFKLVNIEIVKALRS